MAIPSAPTSSATRLATAAPAATGAPASPRGVGDTPSSISTAPAPQAAAAPADPGCCARIWAWVTSIWESIRGCLANLPLIGSWFAPATPPPGGGTAPGSGGAAPGAPTGAGAAPTAAPAIAAPTEADVARLHRIQGVFFTAEEVTAGASNALPDAGLLAFAMGQYRGMETPFAKMAAFRHVLHAGNVTDAVVRDYYNGLPRNLQNAFKGEMYNVNGSSTFGGTDHIHRFGDHMVNHAIRHQVARTAAANMHDQMVADIEAADAAGDGSP